MRIHRFLSLTDLIVATVVLVAIFLPRRPIYAVDAYGKIGPEDRRALASSEALSLARPDDGGAAATLSRRLAAAGHYDAAIEVARQAAARVPETSRWRALDALGDAHYDRNQVHEAFDAFGQALAACEGIKATATPCPDAELAKLQLRHDYLKAGLDSGIDPLKDPRGFRDAAQRAMPGVQIRAIDPGGVR